MEGNMNFKDLLLLFKRRIITILLTFSFIIALASILTFHILEPKYEYSKQTIVGQLTFEKENNNYAQSIANIQLIRSYMDIINSSIILESIIKELGLNQPVSSLNNEISIQHNENSQIVTITVSNSNAGLAREIANLTVLRSKEKMKELTGMDYIQILDQSNNAAKSQLIFPKPLLTIILSVFFGLFTGICLAILKDGFDTTIKNEKDLETLLNIPSLGSLNGSYKKQLKRNPIGMRGDFIDISQKRLQKG
ncbi:Wzz/FepE/Etk N-terminal domain-containing protein [Metabacillus fastidiosus]|uniref:YveK family protein n=1 Tax=Metabacillus fastidiosus TaxID=1458 RepID=UPI003D28CFEE